MTARSWLAGLGPDDSRTAEVDGFTVAVRVVPDEDARLGEDDVTGWFTDQRESVCLRNTVRDWGSDYDWYHPSTYDLQYADGSDAPKGMAKQPAREWAAERIRQAMREDASRSYWIVLVDVSVDGYEIAHASLGWVDVLDWNDQGYLAEVADELIDEAMEDVDAGVDRLRRALARVSA